MAATADALSQELVAAIAGVYGEHAGHRAVHAKGTLCAGTFTATPEAAALSRAAHLQGAPVRAHIRFSNASGKPDVHDGARDGRGMAVKLYLDDGTTTDIVAVDLPVFFSRTAEDFLAFTRARKPDPETGQPDLEKVGAFLGEHPEALPAIQAALGAPPVASYLGVDYRGLHAFRLTDASGGTRHVRYHWVPETPAEPLSDDEAMERSPDFLQEDLAERLPGAFRLFAQIAGEGDAVDDPTVAWPEDRELAELGRLSIERVAPGEREAGDDVLVFDPTRVTDGIECSGDAILHARRGAYAESVLRRSGAALRDA